MQPIKQTAKGVLLHCKVRTNQSSFGISDKGPYVEIKVTSEPLQNKANHEIMKELGKFFDHPIMIVRGLASSDKLILIQDAKVEDVRKKLH